MDNKEFGLVNDGDSVKEVSVEAKEPTLPKDKIGPEYVGIDSALPGSEATATVVVKKKRGRKAKKVEVVDTEIKPVVHHYCSTCRERFSDESVLKIGAGTDRYALFCPGCSKSLGFHDVPTSKIVENLTKNPNQR